MATVRTTTMRGCVRIAPVCVNRFDKLLVKRARRNNQIPASVFSIGCAYFKKELFLQTSPLTPYRQELYSILKEFTLDDTLVMNRERERDEVECPRIMRAGYDVVCCLLDVIYKDKPIDRFWFLENIARMPYFSYVAVLHLYETLGWWHVDSDIKHQHVEQEANETHHLAIMESLYGDRYLWNKLLTRHVAVFYYLLLFVLFMVSPKIAYLSSELLEMHAFDTYSEFAEQNKLILKRLPLTYPATQYLPRAYSMYDVFVQIANDERTHATAMGIVKNYKSSRHS